MFLPNIDSSSIDGMIKLCNEFPGSVYPMMGLHPGSVRENYQDELRIIKENIFRGGFIAVGEIGIDLYWDKSFKLQQQDAFEQQVIIAIGLNLPVVIHARESFGEIFRILDKYYGRGLKGVFHSFTGGLEELRKIKTYDFYFGINGIVTFKNAGLDKIVPEIPLNRILLETDSPYLSPSPKRGSRNESSHLYYINEFLSKLFKVTPGEMAEITSANALELFKLN
jgi:TatD DNase family protein